MAESGCGRYQSLIVSRPGHREVVMPSSYVIGEHFEQFIKGQIQQGRYASASEVIRDGLRALEDREKLRALKLEALRADIQQGINSGPGRPVQNVAAELQARYQNWAEQGAPADAL
jgi:antitoxin ParD1/3/4